MTSGWMRDNAMQKTGVVEIHAREGRKEALSPNERHKALRISVLLRPPKNSRAQSCKLCSFEQ